MYTPQILDYLCFVPTVFSLPKLSQWDSKVLTINEEAHNQFLNDEWSNDSMYRISYSDDLQTQLVIIAPPVCIHYA